MSVGFNERPLLVEGPAAYRMPPRLLEHGGTRAKNLLAQGFGVESHNMLMPASGAMGGTSIARPACSAPTHSTRRVFVIGDSHAAAYISAFSQVTMNTGLRIDVLSSGGCGILNLVEPVAPHCEVFHAAAFASVLQAIGFDTHLCEVPGHVFVGVYLPGAAGQDHWVFVETTMLGDDAPSEESHYLDEIGRAHV